MRKIFYCYMIVISFITAGCNMFFTEIVDVTIYNEKADIAVVGYLSNKGAVVNVQKTSSPLNGQAEAVENAKVELYNSNKHLITAFNKVDDFIYISPFSFVSLADQKYYLTVSAPGFDTVKSELLSIIEFNEIESVELKINSTNYWRVDTIPYFLFGRPKYIELSYQIPNNQHIITNEVSRVLFKYNSNLYEYHQKDFLVYTMPCFFMNLDLGVKRLIEIPDTVSGIFRFFDHITLDSIISYGDSVYNVIDRIDTVLVQTFIFDDGMISFFDSVNEYFENRYDPFSILASKIPSNMSNSVGYFGSVFISEKTVAIPDIINSTTTIVF